MKVIALRERQSLGNMNKNTEQKQVDIINTDERNQLVEFFYPMKIAYYSSREIAGNWDELQKNERQSDLLSFIGIRECEQLRHFCVCSPLLVAVLSTNGYNGSKLKFTEQSSSECVNDTQGANLFTARGLSFNRSSCRRLLQNLVVVANNIIPE